MGMFGALFGKPGSDKADKLRQQALDAFNSIKTPDLQQLQVQLEKYVNAGTLTPEQAEATLLNSNAFNAIQTDPSFVGAQKQALQSLQDVAGQGGLTAVDRARLKDITNQTNSEARGRNEAVMANARERGVGGSGLEFTNRLMEEQAAADRASNMGTDVAAQAEQRALDAIKAAGGLGGQLETQQYGEQANKAQAQNAIDLFNTQTRNATNLYNTQTGNQANAANLANAQTIANANTGTANANKEYNAEAAQKVFQDEVAKANGKAGILNGWANDATADANKEQAGNLALTSGALKMAGTALGGAFGGPAGAAAAGGGTEVTPQFGKVYNPTDKEMGYATGGAVHEEAPLNENSGSCEVPDLETAYNSFVKQYCYGGQINMADGGMVKIKSPVYKRHVAKDVPSPLVPAKVSPGEGIVVPGKAAVPGDSKANDTVPAALPDGAVVVPRTVMDKPDQIPPFIQKTEAEDSDPTIRALNRLKRG